MFFKKYLFKSYLVEIYNTEIQKSYFRKKCMANRLRLFLNCFVWMIAKATTDSVSYTKSTTHSVSCLNISTFNFITKLATKLPLSPVVETLFFGPKNFKFVNSKLGQEAKTNQKINRLQS